MLILFGMSYAYTLFDLAILAVLLYAGWLNQFSELIQLFKDSKEVTLSVPIRYIFNSWVSLEPFSVILSGGQPKMY